MQTNVFLAIAILSLLLIGGTFGKPAASSTCQCNAQPVNCFVDPCSTQKCPGDSTATCYSNYCGGCNAVWLTPTRKVANCNKSSQCPKGVDKVACLKDPCLGAKCAADSTATCTSDYCGGCNTIWINSNNQIVQCDKQC